MMQNHDFEAIKGYYTEDFMASVEESLTNTVRLFDLPTLEGIMKFIHAHNLKAIDFHKIMANNKVLAEFYGGRGDYYDAKPIVLILIQVQSSKCSVQIVTYKHAV